MFDYNVEERVNDFVAAAIAQVNFQYCCHRPQFTRAINYALFKLKNVVLTSDNQANVTRTNHIMWTMGDDFSYQYAESWFRNMDKLIYHVNKVLLILN